MKGAKKVLGIDLRFGYLFHTLSRDRKEVTENPVSSSTMYDRLKKYLRELNLDNGETPHGIRGACAITLALSGGPAKEVMQHVGWSTSASYQRYNRMSSMVGRGSVSSILSDKGVGDSEIYRGIFESFGETSNLSNAFA